VSGSLRGGGGPDPSDITRRNHHALAPCLDLCGRRRRRSGDRRRSGFGGADEKIPDRFWLEPDKVASDALDALENGDRITVPGFRNQIIALYGQHMPRFVLLPLVRHLYPVGD